MSYKLKDIYILVVFNFQTIILGKKYPTIKVILSHPNKARCMKNKVILSFHVSLETRKFLKKMAINEDKTMATMLEELITMKWQQTHMDKKDGII